MTFKAAILDKRCATKGIAWVRKEHHLHPDRAREAITRVQEMMGEDRIQAVLTRKKARLLRAGLMEYESSKPGILDAALDEPYRKVAARYKVTNGVIWYLKERLNLLAKLEDVTVLSVVQGIKNDINT